MNVARSYDQVLKAKISHEQVQTVSAQVPQSAGQTEEVQIMNEQSPNTEGPKWEDLLMVGKGT